LNPGDEKYYQQRHFVDHPEVLIGRDVQSGSWITFDPSKLLCRMNPDAVWQEMRNGVQGRLLWLDRSAWAGSRAGFPESLRLSIRNMADHLPTRGVNGERLFVKRVRTWIQDGAPYEQAKTLADACLYTWFNALGYAEYLKLVVVRDGHNSLGETANRLVESAKVWMTVNNRIGTYMVGQSAKVHWSTLLDRLSQAAEADHQCLMDLSGQAVLSGGEGR
jgi:hypothetical protein